jgi:hypothetical protein
MEGGRMNPRRSELQLGFLDAQDGAQRDDLEMPYYRTPKGLPPSSPCITVFLPVECVRKKLDLLVSIVACNLLSIL